MVQNESEQLYTIIGLGLLLVKSWFRVLLKIASPFTPVQAQLPQWSLECDFLRDKKKTSHIVWG